MAPVRTGIRGWVPSSVELVQAPLMGCLVSMLGVCLSAIFGDNSSGLFDDVERATAGIEITANFDEPDDPRFALGMHVLDGTMYRVHATQTIQGDPYSLTHRYMCSAMVPEADGWVSVEITVTCWSGLFGGATVQTFVEPLRVTAVWTATGGADEKVVLNRIAKLLSELLYLVDPDQDDEEDQLPDEELEEALCGMQALLRVQGKQLLDLQRSNNPQQLKEAQERLARTEKRHAKHLDQLKTELETQRAVSQRQRDRADAAERSLRQAGAVGALAVQTASAQQESRISQVEEELAQAEHIAEQSCQEVDQLRGEVYRLREELASYRGVAVSAAGENGAASVAPTDLKDITSWSINRLKDRIVIHPKAARAARKSTFADVPLVYRVLEAMADSYWPMRFEGSQQHKKQWESFLDIERLSYGPTGAATLRHRTAETYHVNWQGRRVPLDLHLQGHSGRDEARTFRVYFHVDEARKLIVIGHLPSHLPNSLT